MENTPARKQRPRGMLGPLILILVGMILLLERNGVIDRHLLWQWLPVIPIFIGASLLAARLRRRSD